MNQLEHILQLHLKKYPAMEWQDLIKLCYQREFGSGHFITDLRSCFSRLLQELSSLDQSNDTAMGTEPLGNNLCRFSLYGLSASPESCMALARLFMAGSAITAKMSAFSGSLPSNAYFMTVLSELEGYIRNAYSAQDLCTFQNYLKQYAASGFPAVHHSDIYRSLYHPAYRVMPESCALFYPLLLHMEQLLSAKPYVVLGIDGRCGGGKTTLSAFLSSIYDTFVIHMDDFFLPPVLRTAERFQEPGGNIHYERLLEEVISPLLQGKNSLSYRHFSCSAMQYDGITQVTPSKQTLLILEGSYSMRPEFLPAYDISIFVDVEQSMQRSRILHRNGFEMLTQFTDQWIPLENRYFEYYNVKEACDYSFTINHLEAVTESF